MKASSETPTKEKLQKAGTLYGSDPAGNKVYLFKQEHFRINRQDDTITKLSFLKSYPSVPTQTEE